jgi:hypothetical protein
VASPEELDYSVAATSQAGIVTTLGIVDRSGLLAEAPEALAPPPAGSEFSVERVPGEASVVDYGWLGGACPADSVLAIEQRDSGILFDFFPGHARGNCSAAGVAFRIRLRFKASIEESELVTHLQPMAVESDQP